MLTMTPHIVRTPDVTEDDLLPIWVGTEANITFRGGSPRVESDTEGPFEESGGDAATEEKIREQVQRLPRGLRTDGRPAVGPVPSQPEQQPATPGGVNLVPGSAPSNPFAPAPKPEPPQEEEPPGGGMASFGGGADASGGLDLMAAGAASATAPTAVALALVPQATSVGLADRFEVDLVVETTTAVSHLPATIEFDPSRLAIEAVVAGGFLGGVGAAQVVADTSVPGRVVLGASRLGDLPGVAGRGVVARLRFRALAPGAASVRLAAHRVMDKELDEIASVATADAGVEVLAAGVAPLPRPAE